MFSHAQLRQRRKAARTAREVFKGTMPGRYRFFVSSESIRIKKLPFKFKRQLFIL